MEHQFTDTYKIGSDTLIDEAWKVFTDYASTSKEKRVLKLTTDASHSGKIINDRVYPAVHVRAGAKQFGKGGAAYQKPFIRNHDEHSDAIGRIVDAEFKALVSGKKLEQDYLTPTETGSGVLTLTSHITDEEAQEKFLNGTYQTVSMGGYSPERFCSTCSKRANELVPWLSSYTAKDKSGKSEEHECDHMPARIYDGEPCYLITGKLRYAEVSQVNVPADDRAVHTSMDFIKDAQLSAGQWESYVDAHKNGKGLFVGAGEFAICDAEGNELVSLKTDKFKPTKKSVDFKGFKDIDADLVDASTAKPDSKDHDKLSDQEFAKAHIFKHMSVHGFIKLNDADQKLVGKLDTAVLTDTQKQNLDKALYVGGSVPFTLIDADHAKELLFVTAKIENASISSTIKDAIEQQSHKENIFTSIKDNLDMTKDEQISALQSDVGKYKGEIADLSKKLDDKTKEFSDLYKTIVGQKATKLVSLRKELEYHDAVKLDEAGLKDLANKYVEKGEALVDALIADHDAELTARKQRAADAAKAAAEAGTTEDEVVKNPLESFKDDKDKTAKGAASEGTIKDSNEPSDVFHSEHPLSYL